MRSRRELLKSTVGFAGAAALLGREGLPSAESKTKIRSQSTLRDRMWIFTVCAGANDDHLRKGGIQSGSRMTPAEGAFYLGVPNLILVRHQSCPPSPGQEPKRTGPSSFEQYATSFLPLKRVLWSVVGSGGTTEKNEISNVLDLAPQFPNIVGVYMDDFFVEDRQGGRHHTGSLSPQELQDLKGRLNVSGRSLEMWATFYSRVFDSSHPRHFKIDLPMREYLDHFDVITLWTRGGNRLENLEEYLGRLEEASPGPHKAIGCDFWDFLNKAPVPIRLMEHQCNLGLKWLREGRIREMIFLANTVMDVGLEVVEWTRDWIAEVGDEPAD